MANNSYNNNSNLNNNSYSISINDKGTNNNINNSYNLTSGLGLIVEVINSEKDFFYTYICIIYVLSKNLTNCI